MFKSTHFLGSANKHPKLFHIEHFEYHIFMRYSKRNAYRYGGDLVRVCVCMYVCMYVCTSRCPDVCPGWISEIIHARAFRFGCGHPYDM